MINKKIYIYVLINPLNNGIFYVGYTNNPKRRLNEHIKYKNNPLKDAVIESILRSELKPEMKVIDECDFIFNQELKIFEHERLEIYYIKKYRGDGIYLTNLTDGGGLSGGKVKPIYQFDEFGNYMRKYDSLTQASESVMVSISKISVALDQKINKSSAGYYWFTSIDGGKNIKFRKAAKKNISILQYSLDGNLLNKFKGQGEAERITGIKSKLINKCLRRNGYDQAGGYMWFYENNVPKEINEYKGRYLSRPVLKFSKDGILLNEYKSIIEATNKNNFKSNTITSNLIGKSKSAGGFVWKYKNN